MAQRSAFDGSGDREDAGSINRSDHGVSSQQRCGSENGGLLETDEKIRQKPDFNTPIDGAMYPW